MMDPVVINIEPPRSKFRILKLPHISDRVSKIITLSAAVVICFSIVIFVVASAITNSSRFKASHGSGLVPAQVTGSTLSAAALPGGSTSIGKGGTSSNTSPVVTLTATPGSVALGGHSHLVWQATNNPTSCTASDDWSGSQPSSGSADTQALTKPQTYIFTLTCKNKGGTGFATVSVGSISSGGSGSVGRPTVSLAANPSAVYIGENSTLIWTTTNNPTSCSASGDWSGSKASSGGENTPNLTSAKQYSFTLTCKNSSGTGYATATVAATQPPANIPLVTISSSVIGNVGPGTSITLTWSTDNNPTSCTASGDWSGAKAASGSASVGPLNTIKTYNFQLTCSNNAGSAFSSAAVQVIPKPPVVSLTASPSSIQTGSSSTLTWSSTFNPTSCSASGDWSGAKAASGSQSTGTLNTAKTYVYNLSCTNAGGTGYINNVSVLVSLAPAPVVSLSINPISTTVGGSATLTWSVSNNPTSCTAGGDWSGAKAASGSQSTGALNTARTYSYGLSCTNSGGTNTSSTSITVSSGSSQSSKPVVTLSVSPSTIGTGSSATLSWSATNNPTSCTAGGSWSGAKAASGSTSTGTISTAGTTTYSLSCSNSAGSGSATTSLSAIATPVINISVSPSSINTGSSATLSWNVGNSPASCTAGGSWSGSKAASGSQSVSPASSGVYTYSLSCTNSGGTSTNSVNLTVNTVAVTYCNGQTPCYGPNDLAQHASVGNCWGYNLSWVIDITSYAPNHKGGTGAGNLQSTSATCNHDIHSILTGASSIPGYKDKNGATTHGHSSSTVNNTSSSALSSYVKGYYDASKP